MKEARTAPSCAQEGAALDKQAAVLRAKPQQGKEAASPSRACQRSDCERFIANRTGSPVGRENAAYDCCGEAFLSQAPERSDLSGRAWSAVAARKHGHKTKCWAIGINSKFDAHYHAASGREAAVALHQLDAGNSPLNARVGKLLVKAASEWSIRLLQAQIASAAREILRTAVDARASQPASQSGRRSHRASSKTTAVRTDSNHAIIAPLIKPPDTGRSRRCARVDHVNPGCLIYTAEVTLSADKGRA